jgi:AraC-like DNA-binding protein
MEVAENRGWDVDDIMFDGHYVSINLGNNDMIFEALGDEGWVARRMQPGTFWINPEGTPFSVKTRTRHHWAGAVIDGKYLDEVIGHHYELRGGFAIVDEVLSHLMRALVSEVNSEGRSGPRFSETLINAFIICLAQNHGKSAPELAPKGGIAPYQLKSLLTWIENELIKSITVGAMANQVGLSPAHFAREFKRSTGLSPWGYVIGLRLEKVRVLLEQGDNISDAAVRCGFVDQAHLTRLFRQRFGISPGAYIKGYEPV